MKLCAQGNGTHITEASGLRHESFLNPSTSYAKNMLKTFEDINEEKWDKAYKRWCDIKEDSEKETKKHPEYKNTILEALYPLHELAFVMFEIAPPSTNPKADRPKKDYWDAYSRIKAIENEKASDVTTFLSLIKENKLSVPSTILEIEKELYKETKSQNTAAAYDKLINSLRLTSTFYSQAWWDREPFAYNDVLGQRSVDSCEVYLSIYTPYASDIHRTEVTKLRDSLAYDLAEPNAVGMEKYIKKYPLSELVPTAKKRLYKYAYDEMGKSVQDCADYLKAYPGSPYANEVKDSMAYYALQDIDKIQDVKQSIYAYSQYCKTYPTSKWYDEAKKKKVEAERNYYISNDFDILSCAPLSISDSVILNYYYSRKYTMFRSKAYAAIEKEDYEIDYFNEVTYLPTGEEYKKEYFFKDGLISKEVNSRQGVTTFEYAVMQGKGFYLKSKNESRGKKLSYTPIFADNGLLIELIASDGSREKYHYDTPRAFQRSFYSNGAKQPYLIEKYIDGFLRESSRNGTRAVYEYNRRNDLESITKYSGKNVIARTTFDYNYVNGSYWKEYRQYSATGQLLVRKIRDKFEYHMDTRNMVQTASFGSTSVATGPIGPVFKEVDDDRIFDVVENKISTLIVDKASQPIIVGGLINKFSGQTIKKKGLIISNNNNDLYITKEAQMDKVTRLHNNVYNNTKPVGIRFLDCSEINEEEYLCRLLFLKGNSDYYVRAYAISNTNEIIYGDIKKIKTQYFNRYNGRAAEGNVWHAFDYTLFDLITDEIIDPTVGFYYSTNENPQKVRYQKGTGSNSCYKFATEWNYKLWYYHNTNFCDRTKIVSMPKMKLVNGKLEISKAEADKDKSITIYYCIDGKGNRPEHFMEKYTSPLYVEKGSIVYCYAISSDGYMSHTNIYKVF
jgi:hypothetical protein